MHNNQDMTKANIHCMEICSVWKEFYSENNKTNLMKLHEFFYGFWKSGEWKLILTRNFVSAGQNYYEPCIDEAHVATAHGGGATIMQYLTDRYQSQSVSALVQSFMAICDTCLRVKQLNKPPLVLVIPLPVLVRTWTDILMDHLKLTPVCIKCSTMYHNSEIDDDYSLYISCIWTIVDVPVNKTC